MGTLRQAPERVGDNFAHAQEVYQDGKETEAGSYGWFEAQLLANANRNKH